MIDRRFIDAKVYVGGYELTGDVGETELRFWSEVKDASTWSGFGQRGRKAGQFHVELAHCAYSVTKLVEKELENVPVTVVDNGRCYFFLAERASIRKVGRNDEMNWYDLQASSEGLELITAVIDRIPTAVQGQRYFCAGHDINKHAAEFHVGNEIKKFPDGFMTFYGVR